MGFEIRTNIFNVIVQTKNFLDLFFFFFLVN
jgi:hypothetical protein